MKMRQTRKQTSRQRAVWRNGGCGSLEITAKQQVTWLVASVCSLPLRQAATTKKEFLKFSVVALFLICATVACNKNCKSSA